MSEPLHPTPHVAGADVERFVQQKLAPWLLPDFEAHVSRCDACAALLAREARLELTLRELAATKRAAPAPARASSRRARNALLALAACLTGGFFAASVLSAPGAADLPVAHAQPAGGIFGAADLPDGGSSAPAPRILATWDAGGTRAAQ